MNILKDLPDLVKQGILSDEVADKIRVYYKDKEPNSSNRLFMVFAILGSILVGLGLFLIIAHNWDDFSNGLKTFFAFLPLVAGIGASGYSLIKTPDSKAWREASAAFLFLSIGVCLALIAQIYHLPDDLSMFLLKWMVMGLPIAYVMGSSMSSLLFFLGISYLSVESGYNYRYRAGWESYSYWPLLLAGLPFYVLLARKSPQSNFVSFHHWVVPISVAVALGTLGRDEGHLLVVAYFSLFALFYVIGSLPVFRNGKTISDGYAVIGLLGQIVLLLVYSFDGAWSELLDNDRRLAPLFAAPEWYAAWGLTFAATGLLIWETIKGDWKSMSPLAPVFLLFAGMYVVGMPSSVSAAIINLVVFASAILTIERGARKEALGTLNLGMLILSALIVCRFFDADLSFVLRGILFVLLGIGFFAANYWLISKRNKQHGK